MAVLVGDVAGEPHVVASFGRLPRLTLSALEAMQDDKDPGASENSHRVVERLPGVDDQGQARIVGQRDYVLEKRPLYLLRPIPSVVVEPHLAQSHDTGRLRELGQRFEVWRRVSARIVRVYTGRRVNVRQRRRELRPFPRVFHVRPDVDQGEHPRPRRPLYRLLRRNLQPREVRVRIHKHKSPDLTEPVSGSGALPETISTATVPSVFKRTFILRVL